MNTYEVKNPNGKNIITKADCPKDALNKLDGATICWRVYPQVVATFELNKQP